MWRSQLAFPEFGHLAISPYMNDQGHILRELRSSIAEALKRAEERMSHVQRQLAGWSLPHSEITSIPENTGWDELEVNATQLTNEVDQELASVQSSLTELAQHGRHIKSTMVDRQPF